MRFAVDVRVSGVHLCRLPVKRVSNEKGLVKCINKQRVEWESCGRERHNHALQIQRLDSNVNLHCVPCCSSFVCVLCLLINKASIPT